MLRHLTTACLVLLSVAAHVASAGDVCVDAEGDCFAGNGTPGCADPECCQLVCDIEPFCCDVVWDLACGALADQICEPPPPCPGDGPCFTPHENIGCEDEACCLLVCGIDPFCCGGNWDAICVEEALTVCPVGYCESECPGGAIAEPEPCGEQLNDGCSFGPPFLFTPIACGQTYCGTVRATGARDTDWYEITFAEATTINMTLTAEFPGAIFVVTGDCELGFNVEASGFTIPCQPGTLVYDAPAGLSWLVVTTGTALAGIFSGIICEEDKKPGKNETVLGNGYAFTLGCGVCPGDATGDGVVNVADLVAVLTAWGDNPGDPADLNLDGVVNVVDLLIVLSNFGPC